ncbi:MAG: rhomboid family intramembrane serine protease [Agathobacter sp.]|nr:rhomboid family intramembrane serine protease [Agathobacter sp.]
MNFMDKLQKKFGKYAVYNLQKYLILAYCLGLVLNMLSVPVTGYLGFSMDAILHGQIWRLVTWVFCADGGSFISLIFLYCVYSMAQSFEQMVGTFRMNVYLVGGMLLNLFGGILVYAITLLLLGEGISVSLSNYEMLFTIFMALALCMPEATVYLSFLFPIKMKWMFLVYIAMSIYQLYNYFSYGNAIGGVMFGLVTLVVNGSQILLSLLNLFLFFHLSKIRLSRKQKKVQNDFRRQMASTPKQGAGSSRHKCAICGRTENDDPNLSFRYCSKCTGNKEYCQDHLFTHTHN